MGWTYRVMRHKSDGPEPPHLAIHEVYDDPVGWTSDPVRVGSESIEGLRETLFLMRRALMLPVLDHETGLPAGPEREDAS